MSTEREELASIIQREYVRAIQRKRISDCWDAPADAIVAAGYRKHRTISTAEEVDGLPIGSKLFSERTNHLWNWIGPLRPDQTSGIVVHGTGGGYTYLSDFIKHESPFLVMWEPPHDR